MRIASIASAESGIVRALHFTFWALGTAWISVTTADERAAPPLLELMYPPSDTIAAVLFCPNCIPQPLLIEAHLYGRARLFDGAAPSDPEVADLDLLAFTPVWTPNVEHEPKNRCDYPLAVTSYEVESCLDDLKDGAPWQRIVSRQSPGWPDTFGESGNFEQESFLAGRSAPQTMQEGAQWCLQPIVQTTKLDGVVTADIAFSVDGGLRQCRAEIAVNTQTQLAHDVIASHGCYSEGKVNVPPGITIRVTSPGNVCVHIPGDWICAGSSYPPLCE